MSTDGKRPRDWINLPELKRRIADVAKMMAEEEGLENVSIRVEVAGPAAPGKKREVRVDIEEYPNVDPTDPKWEPFRGGKKWQDN